MLIPELIPRIPRIKTITGLKTAKEETSLDHFRQVCVMGVVGDISKIFLYRGVCKLICVGGGFEANQLHNVGHFANQLHNVGHFANQFHNRISWVTFT
jgi:hypothetical protein